MGTVGAFLRATHSLPALAVTTLVGAVAVARGAGPLTLLWIVASTATGQASVGWSNDYLDRHRDAAAGRTDKPIVAGEIRAETVRRSALVAFPVCVLLSVPLGLLEALVMFAAVSSAWFYNARLKATALSWMPYAVSFGLAPVYVWLAIGDTPPAWLVAGAALLGVAAHLLNVLPDLGADAAGAVCGLPHRLGLRGSLLLACVTLAVVLALVLVAGGEAPGGGAVVASFVVVALIAAVAWSGLRGRGRLGFRLTIGAAAAIVAVYLLLPGGPRA